MRIALVPLDDRPCNRVFPRRLADIAGIELLLPPRGLLGHFLQPGSPLELLTWVEQAAAGAGALVLSVDMMTYGGLVASRSPDAFVEPVHRWAEQIGRIRQRCPALAVYAFSVITRLGITGSDLESRHWHPLVQRHCELMDPAGGGDRAGAEEAKRLAAQIPPELLAGVLSVRRRNHETNLSAVQAVADRVLDALVLAQEDAALRGAHRQEQAALNERIQLLGTGDRTWIYPGADEAGLLLLARALRDYHREIPDELEISFLPPTSAGSIPPYEDRPLCESVMSQVAACGMRVVPGSGAGLPPRRSARLLVYGPGGDLALAGDRVGRDEAAGPSDFPEAVRQAVEEAAAARRHVALADVAAPNGADMRLMTALTRSSPVFGCLSAYAGWNTAGNCIGAVLAHVTCLQAAAPDAGGLYPAAHYRYLFERLVDDWAYQAVVRPALNAELSRQSILPANLGRFARAVEDRIRTLLQPLAFRLFHQHFEGIRCAEGTLTHLESFDVSLCWPRTFEVEIDCRITAEERHV